MSGCVGQGQGGVEGAGECTYRKKMCCKQKRNFMSAHGDLNAGDHRSERPLPTPAPLLTLAASSEEKSTATQEHRGHLNTMSSASVMGGFPLPLRWLVVSGGLAFPPVAPDTGTKEAVSAEMM